MKQFFLVRTKYTNEYVKPAGTDVFKPIYALSLNPEGAALFDDQNSKMMLQTMQKSYPTIDFERIDITKFTEEQKAKRKPRDN